MSQVTLSSKNQITLPKIILKELGIQSGAKLLVRIKPSHSGIVIEPRPVSLTKYYRGSGKCAWKKLGGGEKYLRKERKLWE